MIKTLKNKLNLFIIIPQTYYTYLLSLNNDNFLINNYLLDIPIPGKFFFQDPATNIFELMIFFHHEIMFYMIMLFILVLWFIIRINLFCYKKNFIRTFPVIINENIVLNNTKQYLESYFTIPKNLNKIWNNKIIYKHQNVILEIVWTILPTFFLIAVSFPSLTLLYLTSCERVTEFTIKVIGSQWFWTYDSKIKLTSYADLILYYIPSKKECNLQQSMDNLRLLAFIMTQKYWRDSSGVRVLAYEIDLEKTMWFYEWYYCWRNPKSYWKFRKYLLGHLATFVYWRGDDTIAWMIDEIDAPLSLRKLIFDGKEPVKEIKDKLRIKSFINIKGFDPENKNIELHDLYNQIFKVMINTIDLSITQAKIRFDNLWSEALNTPCPCNVKIKPWFIFSGKYPKQIELPTMIRKYVFKSRFTIPSIDSIIEANLIPSKDLKKGQFRLLEVTERLILPRNVRVRFLVTSTDVLHSWSVPSLGIKVDACPGRLNEVNVLIYRNSVFYGQCSEICGVLHGFMPIVVETVNLEDYLTLLLMAIKR